MSALIRLTIADLDLLPNVEGTRYEIIDGELYLTTQPHWRHQMVCSRMDFALQSWSRQTGHGGTTIPAPGVIFAEDQAVAPDLVWIQGDRFAEVVGEDGKLHAAPDLVIEVLSPGPENERRDRERKLSLYSRQGVREYWIVDPLRESVYVYRRAAGALSLVHTLRPEHALTSPMLPDFTCPVETLFAAP